MKPLQASIPPPEESARKRIERRFDRTALVLQGGGALGAYQAGVIQGLTEAGIEPEWVAGISIGAINSAIHAGNAPERRVAQLRGFWETVCRPAIPNVPLEAWRLAMQMSGVRARGTLSGFEAMRTAMVGAQGFFAPRGPLPWTGLPQPTAEVGFYDTGALKATLERFADFDRINHGATRLSVGAVDVQSGNFAWFDNQRGSTQGRIRAEHIMASGALPPGFAAVEIDGRFYWDGGLMSNTPLSQVLDDAARMNTLVFQVDLWSASGPLPTNMFEVQTRVKDVQYSSRTRAITTQMQREIESRRLLRELLALVPESARAGNPWCQQAERLALAHQYAVIHLIYRSKAWETQARDYEFSELTMRDHWQSGLDDVGGALRHSEWLELPADGREFVTYDGGRTGDPRR